MVFASLLNRPPPAAKLADGSRLEVGGHPVRLKVNPRASRVSLRIDTARREVVATAPSVRRLKEAAAFAGERLPWIAAQLAVLPAGQALRPGDVIEVLGRPCLLVSVARRAEAGLFDEGEGYRLCALGEGEIFATRALRLLRAHALTVLTERTRHHAQALGRPMPAVAVMDARSRWGSCKPAGHGREAVIRYSWRLILSPYAVADYVAAHECAHLLEANHGPRFWALVRERVGSERGPRSWLRAHGARLQAVGRG